LLAERRERQSVRRDDRIGHGQCGNPRLHARGLSPPSCLREQRLGKEAPRARIEERTERAVDDLLGRPGVLG
jgi:hypothetical protein